MARVSERKRISDNQAANRDQHRRGGYEWPSRRRRCWRERGLGAAPPGRAWPGRAPYLRAGPGRAGPSQAKPSRAHGRPAGGVSGAVPRPGRPGAGGP